MISDSWKTPEELRDYLIGKGFIALRFSCFGFDLQEIAFYDLVKQENIREYENYLFLNTSDALGILNDYLRGLPVSIPV